MWVRIPLPVLACSSMVERFSENEDVDGSNPSEPIRMRWAIGCPPDCRSGASAIVGSNPTASTWRRTPSGSSELVLKTSAGQPVVGSNPDRLRLEV